MGNRSATAPPTTFTPPVIDHCRQPSGSRRLGGWRSRRPSAPRPSAGACYGHSAANWEKRLLLTMHHIVSDLWSMGILIRELAALYEASPLEVLTASGTLSSTQTLLSRQRQCRGGTPNSASLLAAAGRRSCCARVTRPTSTAANLHWEKQSLLLPKDGGAEVLSLRGHPL